MTAHSFFPSVSNCYTQLFIFVLRWDSGANVTLIFPMLMSISAIATCICSLTCTACSLCYDLSNLWCCQTHFFLCLSLFHPPFTCEDVVLVNQHICLFAARPSCGSLLKYLGSTSWGIVYIYPRTVVPEWQDIWVLDYVVSHKDVVPSTKYIVSIVERN